MLIIVRYTGNIRTERVTVTVERTVVQNSNVSRCTVVWIMRTMGSSQAQAMTPCLPSTIMRDGSTDMWVPLTALKPPYTTLKTTPNCPCDGLPDCSKGVNRNILFAHGSMIARMQQMYSYKSYWQQVFLIQSFLNRQGPRWILNYMQFAALC